jgi:hypothetical protein
MGAIATGNDWRKVSCPAWGLWCIISTGNDWRKVSCPVWGDAHHLDRKLFAKGFLSGMGKVDSSQQETIGEQFLVRHVSSVYQLNRKLSANSFLSGM